jgi:hypothetical protein
LSWSSVASRGVALSLQVAEDVVLHDREVVALGGRQHLKRHMRAHVGSGRVLHHRLVK